MPILSSVSFRVFSSGFSYNDFISKDPTQNDSLYINKAVLRQMGANNTIFAEFQKPLFEYGWGSEIHSFQVSVGFNGYAMGNFSKNLATLLLEGNQSFLNKTVNFDREKIEVNAYGTLSLGYSRQFSKSFSAGARLKTLFGLTNVHTKAMEFSMMTDDEIYKTNIFSKIEIQTANTGNMLRNKGLAIDAGFVYQFSKCGLELSGSVSDLGFIRWKDNVSSYSGNSKGKVFEFKGITGLAAQSFEEIGDSLTNQFELKTLKDKPYTSFLPVKYLVALSYSPHQKGKAGFIYQYNYGYSFSTIVYSLPMNDWLSLSASNTMYVSRFVNLGVGFEANFKKIQYFGAVENVHSFWLHKTQSLNILLGVNLKLSSAKKLSGKPN